MTRAQPPMSPPARHARHTRHTRRQHTRRAWLALLLAASAWALPASARAEVMIEARALRSYDAPPRVDPSAATALSTPQGDTLLYQTVGAGPDTACVIVSVSGSTARALEYRHEERATQCLSVLPHPSSGGFFVRGVDPNAAPGEQTGVTAYVDAQGVVQWTVQDAQLVAARPRADNGTGEFIGVYDTPHPAMVYSATFDRLLGFAQGKLIIGAQEKPLTQAHVINVQTGRLTVTGQTFGDSGVGIVGGAAERATDGHFLLYFYSVGVQGASFFSYNGRNSISAYSPLGLSWESRFVSRMIYGPGQRLSLLWTPSADADSDTRISVVNDAGALIWEGQWPSMARTAQGELALGRPRDLWVGQDHALVLHQTPAGLYVRVLDARDGVSLGVAPLEGLTPHAPLAILLGEQGSLTLLAYEAGAQRLHEYSLSFMDLPELPPEPADMGQQPPDMALPTPPTLPEVGCGCASTASQGAVHAKGLLLLLLAWAAARLRPGRARQALNARGPLA